MTKDTKLFDLIESEKRRQMQGIELIASENFVSDPVMQAMGSVLTNNYAEGLQLLFGVLKVLVDFQIGENDRGAFLRETQRDRLADAAGGSGYDGDFSFK